MRLLLLALFSTVLSLGQAQGAPPSGDPFDFSSHPIQGIHFYGTGAEETVKNGKPMYSLEMLYTSQWDEKDKELERNRLQGYKDLGFMLILRLDDAWGRTVPVKDDWAGREVFARQCGEIAAWMQDVVDVYIIGNEVTTAPNEAIRDAVWYAYNYNGYDTNCAYDKIKENDPRALVLMAALGGWPGPSEVIGGMSNTDWIRLVQQNVDKLPSGEPQIDGYGIHSYSGTEYFNDTSSPTEDPRFSDRAGFRSFIEYLMPMYEAHGPDIPVFITEANTYWMPLSVESDMTYRRHWLREAAMAVDQWNRSADIKINSVIWYTYTHFNDPGNRDIWGNAMMRMDNERLNWAREDLAWVTANTNYLPGKPGGTLHFEAENYTNSAEWLIDNGIEGIDYHDTSPTNQGGAYRLGQHVQNRPDILALADDNWAIGWIEAGEWLRYRTMAGGRNYQLVVRYARADSQSDKIQLFVDGSLVTTADLPATGVLELYRNRAGGAFHLAAGHHLIQLKTLTGGSRIDWFELRPVGSIVNAEHWMVE